MIKQSAEEPLLPTEEVTGRRRHIKKIVVSGVGFFSDAYDLFIINIVMVILANYFDMTATHKSWVSAAALWGAVMGQLGFGFIADKIGRKRGFVITLSMVVVGAIASALSFETPDATVFVSLSFFRFFLGIGIGGEYPLSATITAESAKSHERGRMTALVFSMQGVGSLVASITGFLLLDSLLIRDAAEGDSRNQDILNFIWRVCLGLGAVPGLLSLYFRVTMEETERFLSASKNSAVTTNLPVGQKVKAHLLHTYNSIKPFWKSLVGTAGTWLLFDIVFYANGLFSATLISILQGNTEGSAVDSLIAVSKINIYLALIALPGYWVGVFLIEVRGFGRKNTQIYGFIALTLTYIIIGATYDSLIETPALFIMLYGMTFFFCNAGPNTTTFVLPSEAFPTHTRATCHGISAAAGKVGAVLGASMMAPILEAYGIPPVLYICAAVCVVGGIVTFFFCPETRGKTLEQLSEQVEKKQIEEHRTVPLDD